MLKKILSIVLLAVLVCSIAVAEDYYEEDPAMFVTNKNGAKVWSAPGGSGAIVYEVLPYRACFFNWYPYDSQYVGYDYGGDSGFVSRSDLSEYPDGENIYPPLYVVNCNEWISVWEEPASGSGRLAKLPLGTEIREWLPFSRDFIWYEQNGVYGFVSWDYLTYNP